MLSKSTAEIEPDGGGRRKRREANSGHGKRRQKQKSAPPRPIERIHHGPRTEDKGGCDQWQHDQRKDQSPSSYREGESCPNGTYTGKRRGPDKQRGDKRAIARRGKIEQQPQH